MGVAPTRRGSFRAAVRATSLWAVLFAGLFALVYFALGPLLIGLLTTLPEVRATALTYLPWMVISPLLSMGSFQLDGIFLGATRTGDMRNAMIFSVICYGAGLAIFLPLLGNHGLWLSLMLLMVARAASLGFYYPRLERSVESAEAGRV
jgi:MATE family multidrug resistance protein